MKPTFATNYETMGGKDGGGLKIFYYLQLIYKFMVNVYVNVDR